MFFMCFLLWEKNISKCFSSMILSILSSAYGVGFERRCIGDKPDVQYHYFYKSCSREAIAYIYHRLDSFLYWTTEHVFSVFFVQANHARICPWKHRFNLCFFGVPFDQRHVVWRYYDAKINWLYYDIFPILWPTTCCLALLRQIVSYFGCSTIFCSLTNDMLFGVITTLLL